MWFDLSRGSSFLKTGVTLAILRLSRKFPVSIALFIHAVVISKVNSYSFRILVGMFPPTAMLSCDF